MNTKASSKAGDLLVETNKGIRKLLFKRFLSRFLKSRNILKQVKIIIYSKMLQLNFSYKSEA